MKSKMFRTSLIAGLVAAVGVTAAVTISASASEGSGSGSGTGPRGRAVAQLTDEQKACMQAAGITKPEGVPTEEQRAAIRAAAESCGIELPVRPNGPLSQITDEQKSCLQAAGITKPEGRPTAEQRAAIRAAAESCGIELPAPRA